MTDENIIYVDEEGAISFRAIGHFFAKAWVRMLIWFVAAAVLTTIVVLPLKSFVATDRRATMQIELSYEGASDGLLPDGSAFNKNMIATNSILSKAVAATGIEVSSIVDLASCVTVSAALTEEYLNLRAAAEAADATDAQRAALAAYIPTKFEIKLDVKRSGLTDDESEKLVSAIVDAYREDFKTRYIHTSMIDPSTFDSDMSDVEFTTALISYENVAANAYALVQRYSARDASFISSTTNKMFSSLATDYQTLITTVYDTTKNFIEGHNVWRNRDRALTEQQASLANYTRLAKNLEDLIASQAAQLQEIEKNSTTITGGGTTTIKTEYPAIYNVIATAMNENNNQLSVYNLRIAECEAAISRLNAPGESIEKDIAEASTMLANTAARSKAFVEDVNKTIADYNDREFSVNSITTVAPVYISTTKLSFSVTIVYLVVCAVAVIIAMIISGVKVHNGKKKLAAAEEQQKTEHSESE